jgi:hypothetical protein
MQDIGDPSLTVKKAKTPITTRPIRKKYAEQTIRYPGLCDIMVFEIREHSNEAEKNLFRQ